MLSRAGQELIAEIILSWSARKEVKAPGGKPDLDSIKLATFDWEKAASEKGQLLGLYFKYFQSR
jgi:hypothetical protein